MLKPSRGVHAPAMQNGPLFGTMFPTYSTISSAARDVMTQWYIDRLKEALEGEGDHMFLKACQHTEDGVDDNQTRPVGISGC